MKDALNRRSRFSAPQPETSELQLTERDLAIFDALDLHGKLPSNYLFALTKKVRRDATFFTKRLTQLYNGYCLHPDHKTENKDGHECRPRTFISRDPRQFLTFNGHCQHLVYELTPYAKYLLIQAGKVSYSFKRSGAFEHDLFSACLTASFQLGEPRFITRNEILDHPSCPQTTRDDNAPFAFRLKNMLLPDDVFGVEYPEGGFRFFALEVDRASERINTEVSDASSIAKKLKNYCVVLEDRMYQTKWGIKNLTILFPTTSKKRADNIVEYIRTCVPQRWQHKFLVRAFDGFSKDNWRVPTELLDVYGPWKSTKGEVYINKKASA